MKLSFYGAARSVTGSRHLLEMPASGYCSIGGLFQGRREEALQQNRDLGLRPEIVKRGLAVPCPYRPLRSLAGIASTGFAGKVYVTTSDGDLPDHAGRLARVQESDCRYVNKREKRRRTSCIRPFYDSDDVGKDSEALRRRPVRDQLQNRAACDATFNDAGHILGSRSPGKVTRARGNYHHVLFSAISGGSNMPIFARSRASSPCDVLIIESRTATALHETSRRGDEAKGAGSDHPCEKPTRARSSSPPLP